MFQGRRVLLIEENDQLAKLYETFLVSKGADVLRCADGASGVAAVQNFDPVVILLDIPTRDGPTPEGAGFATLKQLRAARVEAPVVAISADGSPNWSVEAKRLGAYDFLVKPFDPQRLFVTAMNAIERHDLVEIVGAVTRPLSAGFHDFIGGSAPMQAIYRTIAASAASRASVFITGESGTGKELCARAIHKESPRRGAKFVALNCGAIPRDLIESEIFGHRKGAFTGASSDRVGAADLANGGTLFLDEIGEMDMDLQTKLLRFIQTGTFTRVGESSERSVNLRFVCATNREPEDAIRAGLLREDLFYRLNVIPIRMPPLRARLDDINSIAMTFLQRFSEEEGKDFKGFSGDAFATLRRHSWPGNVRELENVVRNAVVLNAGDVISRAMVTASIGAGLASGLAAADMDQIDAGARAVPEIRPLAEVEREAIEAAVQHCNGNIPRAAAALQVAPSTLYRKLQLWKDAP